MNLTDQQLSTAGNPTNSRSKDKKAKIVDDTIQSLQQS
jgi:hypothetical protein